MKTVKVTATFEGLLEPGTQVVREADASTVRSAISRALSFILKAPELKSKRIKTINLAVEVGNKETT